MKEAEFPYEDKLAELKLGEECVIHIKSNNGSSSL